MREYVCVLGLGITILGRRKAQIIEVNKVSSAHVAKQGREGKEMRARVQGAGGPGPGSRPRESRRGLRRTLAGAEGHALPVVRAEIQRYA